MKPRQFSVGQPVMVKILRQGPAWIPQLGPVSYIVSLLDGRHWKRHVDHLRERVETLTEKPPESDNSDADEELAFPTTMPSKTIPTPDPPLPMPPINTEPVRHYPERVHWPPDRFGFT